jgi:hypothetical protein
MSYCAQIRNELFEIYADEPHNGSCQETMSWALFYFWKKIPIKETTI